MSKILKSLQFVTQSASPSTPATGTGALFASGSSIFFENTTGTVFDLAATNSYIVTRSYTGSTNGSDVTYTWSKLPGLKYLDIVCVGGGGGGAGGRCQSATTINGSTGGGGGAIVWLNLAGSQLDSSYTITVGAGGTPGVPRICTGVTQTGSRGGAGGDTSFGNLVIAKGGGGGSIVTAGTSQVNYGAGGQASACTPSRGPWAIQGCTSGNAGTTRTTAGQGMMDPVGLPAIVLTLAYQQQAAFGFGGGGGGCGSGANSLVLHSGSDGSGLIMQSSSLVTELFGGIGASTPGTNGGAGQDNKGLMLYRFASMPNGSSAFSSSFGLGTGGGGGCGVNTNGATAGSGGPGGYYGAGGGGGGVCATVGTALSPVTTGAGGSGSSGLCLLIEYY